MTNIEKDKYWIWLSTIPKMWHKKAEVLLKYFDDPREIYLASEKKIASLGIFTEKEIYNIVNSKDERTIEILLEKMVRKNIFFVNINSDSYPEKLKAYDDKPIWIYYKGSLPTNEEKLTSIVGARNCSEYGRAMAADISERLARHNVGIVSGMARGIDVAAHKGALKAKGKTYAILGCGVDVCYPRENIDIYMQIIEKGGIISEYPPGTNPLAWQFPERNRIISMFADNVAIMEAKKQSGSLITTDYALKYGKEIFALPGRVGDSLCEGCNDLIKSGALMLTEADDILLSLGIFGNVNLKENDDKNNIVLEKENKVVYSCLDLLPQSIEEIVEKTGMPSMKVYEIIMELLFDGYIEEPMRNYYSRKM